MNSLTIKNQINMVAALPVLFIAIILSAYYTHVQFRYITDSLDKHGRFIARELAPASEYAIYSGNTTQLLPLVKSILDNRNVTRIQILDKNNRTVLDVSSSKPVDVEKPDFFDRIGQSMAVLFSSDKTRVFSEEVISSSIQIDDYDWEDTGKDVQESHIGHVIVTLTTHFASLEKIHHLKNGVFITLVIIALTSLVTARLSRSITRPITSLTDSVRDIASGNLDTVIDENGSGEIRVLQTCIKDMASELKHFKLDMENQINEYTTELQETMEELEIRNAELDITRARAISANKAKTEFLANMSHEIRTPLSGIIGFTDLLNETRLTVQQKDYTDTIKKSSNILLQIINDILDLSKIESGKTDIQSSEFNLYDIIEDIINLLAPTAYEKDIELIYQIRQDVPEVIHADPFRIHQIITNLLSNAIKFTTDGYVHLLVERLPIQEDPAETHIKFTIVDTGIGMCDDDRKKLFKAFTQADTTITRRFGGTGLGLVISRKLTELMNGDIGFDSRPGKGSTFWFRIPVTVSEENSEQVTDVRLLEKKIAVVCNHILIKSVYHELVESWNACFISLDPDSLTDARANQYDCDACLIILCRKDLADESYLNKLKSLDFPAPALIIASTRSNKRLQSIEGKHFRRKIFFTERISRIKSEVSLLINPDEEQVIHSPTTITPGVSGNWSSLNILVVDDNDISLRLAEIILDKNQANVLTAHSGAQAIDYAKAHRFDLVFMDLHMPGIDGYETSRTIRMETKNAETPIIALTANVMSRDRDKLQLSGINDLLIKPISEKIMAKVINQWCFKATASPMAESIPGQDEKVFSMDKAKHFTGGNEALASELFAMLKRDIDPTIEAINAALKKNDLDELKHLIHKLHGSSRCCGTVQLTEACRQLEKSLNSSDDFDIDEEVDKIFVALQRIRLHDIQGQSG